MPDSNKNLTRHWRESPVGERRLRLLSYNIQVGIASNRPHHYLTRSWKHVLPHGSHFHNLDAIAAVIRDYDVVGLQEVDSGSLRSSFVNQVHYLAERAGFEHWYQQRNRNLGHIACHSNGLLTRYPALDVENHKLPGTMPGRGAMMARFGDPTDPLVVVQMHLALSRRARMQQFEYVAEMVRGYRHIVLMGDMNCQPGSEEMRWLLDKTGLQQPLLDMHTFPSWSPNRMLDHILVSPTLKVENMHVLSEVDISDHLPISMEVVIPEAIKLVA
ncbi:MAG: endonuclease/exonuclease/phosphatase family protein [Gammaproteobacteria bacterium]|nr:endonuclease/exonuclease/phosphatase family protein [Gammaproteobacteria bacterium]